MFATGRFVQRGAISSSLRCVRAAAAAAAIAASRAGLDRALARAEIGTRDVRRASAAAARRPRAAPKVLMLRPMIAKLCSSIRIGSPVAAPSVAAEMSTAITRSAPIWRAIAHGDRRDEATVDVFARADASPAGTPPAPRSRRAPRCPGRRRWNRMPCTAVEIGRDDAERDAHLLDPEARRCGRARTWRCPRRGSGRAPETPSR